MNTNIATILTISAAVFLGACSKKEETPVVSTPAPVVSPLPATVVVPTPATYDSAASAPATAPENTQTKEQTK